MGTNLTKQVFKKLPQTASIHFLTDIYKIDYSESGEHLIRRAFTAKTYVLHGQATKVLKNSN